MISINKAIEPKTSFLDAYIIKLKSVAPNIFDERAITVRPDLDQLYVIDMQNDFMGCSKTSPRKGRFNVEEGDQISWPISDLINRLGRRGISIVASRDYHPNNHVSFISADMRPNIPKGPFPDHCVMGSDGSSLASDIKKALLDNKEVVSVVFKGIHENIDSFGAIPYKAEFAQGRISHSCTGSSDFSKLSFTGGFEIVEHDNPSIHPIKSSARWSIEDSITEHPKEDAFLEIIRDCTKNGRFELKPGSKIRPKGLDSSIKNLFFTGLAADFCVLDSAINAKALRPDLNVYIIYDLTRYAWLDDADGGFGHEYAGGRFITSVFEIANKYQEMGIKLIHSSQLKFE